MPPPSKPWRNWWRVAKRALAQRPRSAWAFRARVSPATGLVKNANSTWLIGRPLCGGPVAPARPASPAGQRRGLLRAVGSHGRRGRRRRHRVRRHPRHGRRRRHRGAGPCRRGPNAVSGEWGHNPLPGMHGGARSGAEWPGPSCYCGRSGCIETFLSGPGLARDFERHTGRPLSAADVVAGANRGDAEAQACMDRYEDRLARGLASIINVLDPDVIVLGGGLSNAARLLRQRARGCGAVTCSRTPSPRASSPPAHGDSSGVRGAAWLWPA